MQERESHERLGRWAREITEYSHQWSARRDRVARGEAVNEPEPQSPVAPPACRMRTDEEIEAESLRARELPTTLERLTAFARFVEGELYPLIKFGARAGFPLQHGFDSAAAGPVRDAAGRLLLQCRAPLVLRRWQEGSLWNPKPPLLRTLAGHTGEVTALSMTPDGRLAVSSGSDKALRVWDLKGGHCLAVLNGHRKDINSVSVTPDGRRAVSGSDDGTVRVWDLESGACVGVLEWEKNICSVEVTPDGRRAIAGNSGGALRLWDLKSGESLATTEQEGESTQALSIMGSVTPDGRRAVSSWQDKTLAMWDLESGGCLGILRGHTSRITTLSMTPDGRRAVSGSNGSATDRTVRLWDLGTKRRRSRR